MCNRENGNLQTSVVSPEETPVTTLNKDIISEDTMDQCQICTGSADLPASGLKSTTEAVKSKNQLRVFVMVLTVKVLTKCHALKNHSQEKWVAHTTDW